MMRQLGIQLTDLVDRARALSIGQFFLRLTGLIGGELSLILASLWTPGGMTAPVVWSTIAMVIGTVGCVFSTLRPDSTATLAVALICLVSISFSPGSGDLLSVIRLILIGLFLLITHMSWAYAALGPGYARVSPRLVRIGAFHTVVIAFISVPAAAWLWFMPAAGGPTVGKALLLSGTVAVLGVTVAVLHRRH
ncbi:hypothetical protein [Devriesea agamarum]|uniref:hypothetical protein n=1 Tax=Devriesea agamarum TaxID=472569 RepID=UPI00071C23D2|nr:hypothetical protein [Devriesea agamarum]